MAGRAGISARRYRRRDEDRDAGGTGQVAGRSVNCRYTDANRAEMMSSRVDSTRVVGEAIEAAAKPPRAWLQMSTATTLAALHETARAAYRRVTCAPPLQREAGVRNAVE